MACLGECILTHLGERLVDKAIKEVRYFRHFETHISDFEQGHNDLCTALEKLQNEIEDSKKRNENQFEIDVRSWIEDATNLIKGNTEIKQTWSYGWCPYWQYRQGKRLAQRMPIIKKHIDKCKFERVARRDELPGMKYHASIDFIDFESRRATFEKLVQALKDGKHYMVGLYGMGGAGKTTLAKQVGNQLEEYKTFEKVIFIVVSNFPNVKEVRAIIANELGLTLKEGEEAEHSKALWHRISNDKKKFLIILDDVWERLDLRKEVGIPSGADNTNCYVLITTRNSRVCTAMRCQETVQLHALADEEAKSLFLSHGRGCDNSSSNELEALAPDFLKKCGGLPVAIVALASTLRDWNVGELKAALTTLQNSKPFIDVGEDMVEVYQCLKLSFDNLKDMKAQQLFLLCSIFPEDYEFPINLIIRLGIGSGIFGEVDEYRAARTQALLAVKNKLIASSLLHKVEEEEYVKMHDLVREVAQWIAKKDIQVIMDSTSTSKANKRFVFWRVDDFLDQFDGTKIEVLVLWVSGNVLLNDPNTFFAGMTMLKILFLRSEYFKKVPTSPSSLLQSLLLLKSIHTLILDDWELGDISVLRNVQSLVTLELKNCIIIELPKYIKELKKLRWLGLRNCEIQKKNPFEVIERCSQLEDLYFVGNYSVDNWKPEDDKEIEDEVAHDISPSLQMFSVACDYFEKFANDDNGLLKCFSLNDIENLISEAMFKYLVGKAEVLELGKIGPTIWKSLVHKIIPLEDGGMDNLMKVYLYEGEDIEFLIDNSNYHYSNVKVFSKLIELHLYDVDVKQLYWGAMPPEFLKQLQILKLEKCMKLQSIFLDENLKLPYLRDLELRECPMLQPSLFQLSVAGSLMRLEKLVIEDCKELQSLIANESLEGNQKNYDSLFPNLNSVEIIGCGKLEMMILPLPLAGDLVKLELGIDNSQDLKCIFGENTDVGQVLKCKKCKPKPPLDLKESSTEKYENSKKESFSWALKCCLMSPTKDANIGVSNATLECRTFSRESCASSKEVIETFHHTAECFLRQPLSLKNVRQITLGGCSKVKSLFSVSIATTMIMLEDLKIIDCEELKNIMTKEAEDDNHLNCTCIFPELQKLTIIDCNDLELIFPSTLSGGLQKLKSIYINGARELKYVFGKHNKEECVSNENENNEPPIHLPALESLSLKCVPNIISIGIKEYQFDCQSLQHCVSNEEIKKQKQDVTSEGEKECEIQEIVHVESPLTPTMAFQYFLHFHNLKEISISRNKRLKTLFCISAYRNLPQLSKLDIFECEELVNVVEDDSNDLHHMNSSSVFPKLEGLFIYRCNKMEFIFPSSLCGTLQRLKSLLILGAAELNYIFWNESDELPIHLPALETISFKGVPKIINKILARKYHLSFLHLQSIELQDLEEFNGRSFLDLMAYLQGIQLNMKAPKDMMKMMKDVQKLTRLTVGNSKIEEVLNLEGVEIERPVTLSLEEMRLKKLNELGHICKGPKDIVSLHNLCKLYIIACKKLKSIFCVSIVKSLPQLYSLSIEDCDELVEIIEESDADHLHNLCFPKLEYILIRHCNSLKCTFSISKTPAMFPELRQLRIEEAPKLEKVFIRKQDDTENMGSKDVFPMLSELKLRTLPMLVAICEGVDFQTVECQTEDCLLFEEITFQLLAATKEQLSVNSNNAQGVTHVAETSGSLNLAEITEEKSVGVQGENPTIDSKKHVSKISAAKPQLRTSLHELEDEHKTSESTTKFQQEDLGETNITQSIKEITEPSLQENYATEDAMIATQSTNSKQSTRSFINSVNDSAQELKDEQSTCEATLVVQLQDHRDTKIPIKAPLKAKIPFDDDIFEETKVEVGTAILASPATSISLDHESVTSLIVSQAKGSKSGPSTFGASMKETHEQGSQKDDATEKAAIAIQSTNSKSRKQTRNSVKTEKGVRIHASQLSMDPTWTDSKITQSIKGTMEQGHDEDFAEHDIMTVVQSTNSGSTKQIEGPIDNLSGDNLAPTIKETIGKSSVQEEAKSEKPRKAIISQVIPSLHHHWEFPDAGTTSSPNKLGVCEIFQFVELKDGETALLAQALERYPQLLLPHKHHSRRMIAWSYRVLVDILVVLATKTPYSIKSSEKSTLEANLCDATLLGFDKSWVDSVRARVFGADKSDMLAAEEEIQVKEAELETCDIALEQIRNQRIEAGERLAVVQRQLVMAQSEIEAIDSQFSGLMEDRKKLITEITECREIISANDRPYGI